MLVYDSGIVRRCLLETIEHSDGFTIVGQTGESEKALGLAQRLRPDLILLDVLMPGRNGIDARRAITAALPGAKVPMLNALTDRLASNRALAAGAAGYLPKLWGRDQFLNTLSAVVEGRYLPDKESAVGKGRGRTSGNKMA